MNADRKTIFKFGFLLPLRCVIFFLIFAAGAALTKQKTEDISNWWSVAASAVNIAVILLLYFIAKKNKSSYAKLINYEKGKTKAGQIIGISALTAGVGMAGMYAASIRYRIIFWR